MAAAPCYNTHETYRKDCFLMKKIIALTLVVLSLVLCLAGCGAATEAKKEPTAGDLVVTMMDDYYAYLDDASQNHCCIQYFTPVVTAETNNADGTVTVTGLVNGSAMYITGDVAPFSETFSVTLKKTEVSYEVVSAEIAIPDAARY